MATTQRTYDLDTSALKASLRGELIQPGDESYDAARKVYNGMIDKHPALIVRCADVADVIAAVNFGRENNLLVSIRGGGHNAGGLGVCDDGLVIDLSLIRYTHVDPQARTVRVGEAAPGATSTTPPTLLAWRSPVASFPQPAWADSPWVEVWGT